MAAASLEVALLLAAALGLDFAEVVHGFLELAGEPLVVQAEGGEGAVGVDDVEVIAACSVGGWRRDRAARLRASGMRLRRQAVSASSWMSWVSVGVAGRYSSKKPRRWASYAARSSEARTAQAAVKPWRSAFNEERCLPESVRGPVECRELARLMAVRSTGLPWMGVIGVVDIWETSEPG